MQRTLRLTAQRRAEPTSTPSLTPCALSVSYAGQITQRIAESSPAGLLDLFGTVPASGTRTNARGFPLDLVMRAGKVDNYANPTSATAWVTSYLLVDDFTEDADDRLPSFDTPQEKLEKELFDYLEARPGTPTNAADATIYTTRSQLDAILDGMLSNWPLLIICMFVMVIYLLIFLGNWALAFCGLGAVMLAIMGGFALGSIGMPITFASQFSFFLTLAIGVDNLFIIFSRFQLTCPRCPIEDRIGWSLRKSGVSVTYANVANLAAFLTIGSSSFPMLVYFVMTTAIMLVLNFILDLTLFVACMCLYYDHGPLPLDPREWCGKRAANESATAAPEEQKTVAENAAASPEADSKAITESEGASAATSHYEVVTTPKTANQTTDKSTVVHTASVAVGGMKDMPGAWKQQSAESCPGCHELDAVMRDSDLGTKLFSGPLSKALRTPWVQYVLAAIGIAMFAFSVATVDNVSKEYDLGEIISPDHFAYKYVEASNDYVGGQGIPLDIVIGKTDYTLPAIQRKIEAVTASVTSSSFIAPNQALSWLPMFRQWLSMQMPGQPMANATVQSMVDVFAEDSDGMPRPKPEHFYSLLNEFLSHGGQFSFLVINDFVFDSNGLLSMTKSRTQVNPLLSINDKEDALDDLQARSTTDGIPSFVYNYEMLFWHMYKSLDSELFINILTASIAVFVVCLVVLPPVYAVATLVLVIVVDIELLAMMPITDIFLNPVSLGTVVLALGLVVDYILHLAATISMTQGPSPLRVRTAMTYVGPSVLNGGVTTFLGVFVLSFASAQVFKTFAYLFFGIVILGEFAGLLLFPVWISAIRFVLACGKREECPPPQKGGEAGSPVEAKPDSARGTARPDPAVPGPEVETFAV